MTKKLTRKPHPARTSRMVLTGASVTALATMVSSFSWNSHVADLAAASEPLPTESAVAPVVVEAPAPIPTPTITVIKTVKKVKKATASKKTSTKKSKKKAASSGSTASSGSSSAAASSSGGSSASSGGAPAAPAVTYTCKSPGGKTKALKNGSCSYVAKYGYVKVQK